MGISAHVLGPGCGEGRGGESPRSACWPDMLVVLAWRTSMGLDCGLIRERSKGMQGREGCCGSVLQVRNDSQRIANDVPTVLEDM